MITHMQPCCAHGEGVAMPRDRSRTSGNRIARGRLAHGLAVAAMAVLATAPIASAMGKIAPRARETFQRTVPVGFYTRINVSNVDGNIIVTGVRGATSIDITANKVVWARRPKKAREAMAGLRIGVNSRGDLLEVRPEHGPDWNFTHEVEFIVRVPANFRVEAKSDVGHVQVRAVREADVKAGKGNGVVSGVKNVTAATTRGAVTVDSTTGPIDVTTVGGDVGARLSGQVESVRIRTTGGGVTLQLPSSVNCELSVTTGGGLVTAEGLTLRDARQSQFGVRGTVGQGGGPVEITSETGAVTVTTRQAVSIAPGQFLRHGPTTTTRPPSAPAAAPAPELQPAYEPAEAIEPTEEALDEELPGEAVMEEPAEPATMAEEKAVPAMEEAEPAEDEDGAVEVEEAAEAQETPEEAFEPSEEEPAEPEGEMPEPADEMPDEE